MGTAIYRDLEYHFPIKLNENKMSEDLKKENDRIYIELTGNGFLYNMVRIIAGTMIEVGIGKIKPCEIPEIIESKDRKRARKNFATIWTIFS